jgi:hypothetical protein
VLAQGTSTAPAGVTIDIAMTAGRADIFFLAIDPE